MSSQLLPTPWHEAGTPVAAATEGRLFWWRFRRHKLAVARLVVLALYLVAAFAELDRAVRPNHGSAAGLHPPQAIHWFDAGGISAPCLA